MRRATTLLTILASLFFYAFALSSPASADPDSPGNNGTVKIVNDQGDSQDDQDNDPHVCMFHIYGFHFDDNSRGTWRIEAWAPGGGPLTASQSNGTWQADGIGKFDAHPVAQPFPTGHYKLFVKETFDPKRQGATPGGDKQKVFWVKCPPTSTIGGATGDTTTTIGGTTTVVGGTTTTIGGTSTIVGGSTTTVGGTTTVTIVGGTTTTIGGTTTTAGGTTTIVGGTTTTAGTTTTIVGGTKTTTGGTTTTAGGTAVRGFESAPNGNAIGSVTPTVDLPGGSNQQSSNGTQAGFQTSPASVVTSLPSTSTSSAPAVPLAALGLAMIGLGGALLRRRDARG